MTSEEFLAAHPSWHVNGESTDMGDAPFIKEVMPSRTAEQRTASGVADDREEDVIEAPKRHLSSRKISGVRRRATRWLWAQKIPQGHLTLLVGREGIGKSTVAYDLAAAITLGNLPGDQYGKRRGVIIVATEDDMEATIAPRLDAAGADTDRMFEVTAVTPDGMTEDLQLPVDIAELMEVVEREDVALVILDPLTSRLASGLDTHKDADVRKALEPLTRFCKESGTSVIGLMHINKGNSGDPANQIMGSRAFPAVARSVLFVQVDEEAEEGDRHVILEVVKANLGPKGSDNLLFEIQEVQTGFDEEENLPIMSSKVNWLGNTDKNVKDAMAAGNDHESDKETLRGASLWLRDYMVQQGGEIDSADVKKAGLPCGYKPDALMRARKGLGIQIVYRGNPRKSFWTVEGTPLATESEAYTATSDRRDGTARESGAPRPLPIDQ